MEEIKKLTPEELNSIKELQTRYNKIVFELGSVEVQLTGLNKQKTLLENEKINISNDLDKIAEAEKEIIDALEVKYGAGNINIETGEITPF